MLQNREIRRFAGIFAILACMSVILGFALDTSAGLSAILFAVAYGAAFWAFTNARYKEIAQISHQIDLVLHNADHLYVDDYNEGELSILHSEITKMTLRIREQNDILKKEKKHLSDSLADISHQLRTPLTSLNLILSLLADESDETRRKAFVREIEELLLKMDWLLTSLLKLSRLDAGIVEFQRKHTNINDLISRALRPLLIPVELHHITIQIDVPEEGIIMGDPDWLSEAFLNVLKNCMENAGENGTIQIDGRDNPLFVEVSIKDSGAGFSKEDIPCLFDRFYRGNHSGSSGYGIGLALSKTIVTRQGGSITAKNHPKGGAEFILHFPK